MTSTAEDNPAPSEAAQGEPPVEIEGEVVHEEISPLTPEAAAVEERALALREEAPQALSLIPSAAEFTAMREMAAVIASTQMVPLAYRGKPDDVIAAILTGREMGIGPMQSLRDIYVVDGKPSLAANLLLAQLRRGGIVVLESSSTMDRAWIRAQRRDTGEIAEVEWTYEEAKSITYRKKGGVTALLVEKDNWVNYRPDMLWARAVGRLARRLGSDMIGAAMPYTSEEVQDWDAFESHAESSRDGWIQPADWTELAKRLGERIGVDESPVWMAELAVKGYAAERIGAVVSNPEVPDETKADLWRRVCRVLHDLDTAEGDVQLRPDHRAFVAGVFSAAFDKALEFDGPAWSLSPSEADSRPQKDAVMGEHAAAPVAQAPAGSDEAVDAEGNPIAF